MKEYTAYFKATCWNEDEGKEESVYGFIPADNFTDAAHQLEEYFKKELISVSIEILDTSLVLMSEEMAKQVIDFNF